MSQAASGIVRVTKAVVTGGASEAQKYVNDKTAQAQQSAQDQANQQAQANADAEAAGPQSVALRDQFFSDQAGAAGAQRSGNESDVSGTTLFSGPRKRGSARQSLGY
jgi:hypothetical protein